MKWFKHDSDAHMDAKLDKILMRFGAEGYAIYWYCLELIAGKANRVNCTFELEHDAEQIGHRLRIDTLKVEEIMKYMIEINLFQFSAETQRVMCLQMAERVDDSTAKSPEIKALQQKIRMTGYLVGKSPKKSESFGAEQNRTDKNRVDKEEKPKKKRIGSHVLLTDKELDALETKYTAASIQRYIENVNDYCSAHGKTYKDYAAAIRTFIRKDEERFNKQIMRKDPLPQQAKSCPDCGRPYLGGVCTFCGWNSYA